MARGGAYNVKIQPHHVTDHFSGIGINDYSGLMWHRGNGQ